MRIALSLGLSALFFLTTGCAATVSPYARATAGRIGCPAADIELDQLERGHGGPESWVAYCDHVGYACSSSRELGSSTARVVCSEINQAPMHRGWRYAGRGSDR